jgi:UDPglucose 6-dehydrogenase
MLQRRNPPPLLLTSTKSAEIIKHASNAFLALKISFINAVSNLCEATDANVEQVAAAWASTAASAPSSCAPGIGYGGSCFPKDVAAFRSVAEQLGVDFNLLTEVEKINVQQKKRFLNKVRSALWTLRGKRSRSSASPSRARPTTSANRPPSSSSKCSSPKAAPSPPTIPPP